MSEMNERNAPTQPTKSSSQGESADPGQVSEPDHGKPIHARYAQRVKARLAKPAISVLDARDGLLDCFIATYYQGVQQGLEGLLAIEGGEEQVVRVTASLFRRKLHERGGSFDAPTVEVLDAVKDEVDGEMHFEELPAELRGLHDQVCALLLRKAGGDLPHAGDRSVVARAGVSPAVRPGSRSGAITVPTAIVRPPQAAPAAPAATPPAGDSSVPMALRDVLATYLEELRVVVIGGASVAELREHLNRMSKLIDTLSAFEPRT